MKIDADGQMVFETDGNPARLHLWSKMVDWFTSLQQAGCGLDSRELLEYNKSSPSVIARRD